VVDINLFGRYALGKFAGLQKREREVSHRTKSHSTEETLGEGAMKRERGVLHNLFETRHKAPTRN
jgi:hypothetical protein